jgi:Resolvase, N terminal domain
MSDKIRTTHLERRAAIYLRQSTLKQVHEDRESTVRQYALRQRAVELGWSSERIDVIDEDLGQSGSSASWRSGFQRLAEIAAELNRRGLSTGVNRPWGVKAIRWVRSRRLHLRRQPAPPQAGRPPDRRDDGLYSVRGVANLFGVTDGIVC